MATILGDSKKVLKQIASGSVDAIITDSPYELGLMNKRWDTTGVSYDVNMWRECLRVAAPNTFLLAPGGSRTYHRMANAIEDAGWQIIDFIDWIYITGFPKSGNLKPAHEPICVARKGKPKFNIQDCRIGNMKYKIDGKHEDKMFNGGFYKTKDLNRVGRYPANVISDGCLNVPYFFCAKPNRKERNMGCLNNHNTVKPVTLLRYLIKLVSSQGQTILDPFMGSGSTGIAAHLEGREFIGIELEKDYYKIANKRIEYACK